MPIEHQQAQQLPPSCVLSPHPLNPRIDRRIYQVPFLDGETLLEYLLRIHINPLHIQVRVTVNGRHIPNTELHHYHPKIGDLVMCRGVVHGGDDGSNPIAAVLSIGLAIIAPGIGSSIAWGLVESAGLDFVTHGIVSTLIGGVVSLAGNALIRSLTAPPAADLSNAQGRFQQPSPTYALQQSSNQIRYRQVMPVVFGEHRMYFDKGARTYTEYQDGDQYIYEIYEAGLSDLEFDEIKIGDTLASVYEDLTIEIADRADGKLTLFPGNVDTVTGAALEQNVAVERTGSIDTTRIGVDITGSLFAVNAESGNTVNLSARIQGQYRAVGDSTWLDFFENTERREYTGYWSKGYLQSDGEGNNNWVQVGYDTTDPADHTEGTSAGTYNPSGWPGSAINVYWHFRQFGPYSGLYSGAITTHYNDPAPAQYYYVDVNYVTITNKNRDTLRKSYYKTVPKGQYEVKLTKLTQDFEGSSTKFSTLNWSQMRSYQPDEADYTGRQRLALKGKATGQFNGPIDTVNSVVRARIAYKDSGGTWRYGFNNNPAWLYLHFARGMYINDVRVCGCGLPDARIDLDGIETWAAWCDANNLTCNWVLDSARNKHDVLQIIARCGRAVPSQSMAGKLGVIYDEENRLPVDTAGMDNIKAGSFKVEYISQQVADQVIVAFTNPELGYKTDYVRKNAPGVTNPVNPVTLEFLGVTSKTQAGEEACLQVFRNEYIRRRIQWETDVQGLSYDKGDVVYLSHDMTQWATSGHLKDESSKVLTLSRNITFSAGEDHYIGIRWPEGDMHVLKVINGSGTTNVITLEDDWPAGLAAPGSDTTNQLIDYKFWFDAKATPGKLVKVVDVKPLSMHSARITAVDEYPEYYESKGGAYDYEAPEDFGRIARVTDFTIKEQLLDINNNVRVFMSWQLTDATGCNLSVSINGASPVFNGLVNGTSYSIDVKGGDVIDVVYTPHALVSTVYDKGGSAAYTVQGLNDVPGNVSNFVVVRNGDDLRFNWDANTEPDFNHYEMRFGSSWDSGVFITTETKTNYLQNSPQAGTYLIKAFDNGGRESAAATAVTIGAVSDINIVVTHDEDAEGWPGTHTNTVVNGGNVQLAGANTWSELTGTWDSYTDDWVSASGLELTGNYVTSTVDLGAVLNSRIELNPSISQVPNNDTWAKWVQPWDYYDVGWTWQGPNGVISATFDIDTSEDAITWDGWRKFVPGYYSARYVRFRINLATDDSGYNARIDDFEAIFDVPDREIVFEDESIASGGTALTFTPEFLIPPVVTVAIQDGAAGDTYKITSKSETGMTVQCFDSTHAAVARSCDIRARAY